MLYGELKHSGRTVNVQPSFFACCIRSTALAIFADLSAVTVNCNTATRITNINITQNNIIDTNTIIIYPFDIT